MAHLLSTLTIPRSTILYLEDRLRAYSGIGSDFGLLLTKEKPCISEQARWRSHQGLSVANFVTSALASSAGWLAITACRIQRALSRAPSIAVSTEVERVYELFFGSFLLVIVA